MLYQIELAAEGESDKIQEEIHRVFSQLCEHFPHWKQITVTDIKEDILPTEFIEQVTNSPSGQNT